MFSTAAPDGGGVQSRTDRVVPYSRGARTLARRAVATRWLVAEGVRAGRSGRAPARNQSASRSVSAQYAAARTSRSRSSSHCRRGRALLRSCSTCPRPCRASALRWLKRSFRNRQPRETLERLRSQTCPRASGWSCRARPARFFWRCWLKRTLPVTPEFSADRRGPFDLYIRHDRRAKRLPGMRTARTSRVPPLLPELKGLTARRPDHRERPVLQRLRHRELRAGVPLGWCLDHHSAGVRAGGDTRADRARAG